jgi:hypothetical protein
MKNLLICALIFTMVLPVYCFANPQENTSSQGIMDEIDLIVEDGIIEKAEIENLMVTLDGTSMVSPSQLVGQNCLQSIVLTLAYLWLSIETDNLTQITSIVFLILNIAGIIAQC